MNSKISESDCLTKSKKGLIEKRIYVSSGKYLIYKYEPVEGKDENSKFKIILKDELSHTNEYYIIPTKGDKYIAIKGQEKGNIGVFKDGECLSRDHFL
ncbi:MAG: hypothetical protein RXN92_02945 [Thermoplasmatales archaeon]